APRALAGASAVRCGCPGPRDRQLEARGRVRRARRDRTTPRGLTPVHGHGTWVGALTRRGGHDEAPAGEPAGRFVVEGRARLHLSPAAVTLAPPLRSSCPPT